MINQKITVITVCYNSSKTIERAIKSVLAQSYNDLEYLVIDGNSQDDTLAILASYKEQFAQKDITFSYISEPDQGIYDAINKGIKMATGSWVSIINSDDWLEENVLTADFAIHLQDNVDLLYGFVRFYRDGIATSQEVIFEPELPWGTMHHQGIIYRKELHNRYGYYSLANRVCSDYLFLASCFVNNAKFKFIDKLIAHFSHGGSHTQLAYHAGIEEAKIKLKFGFITRIEYYKKLIKAFSRKFL